jgi:signal transduction histidine kinase
VPDPHKRTRIVSRSQSRAETLDGGPGFMPESEKRFRALALGALEKEQFERSKLARTLHDEVAQILSVAGLQLDILKMDLEERVPGIASRTGEIQELLEGVVKQIRELSYKLNPGIVERVGLQPALDLLVGRYRNEFPGSLRLTYDSSVRVPTAAAVAMERIAEESLANAVRHSRCSQVEIIVKSTHEGVALQVRDDGTGFDYDAARRSARGLGLLMMEFCANQAGLHLTVNGNDAKGSTVRVMVTSPDGRKHGGDQPE